jgi:uncharacterized membrane protein YebE (DUF533 family)
MNSGNLLEQFMGSEIAGKVQQTGGAAKQKLGSSAAGGFAGGAVAGGLLGLVLGNKKMRKMAKGVIGYGAAAGAGALAYKAYQNWQAGKSVADAPVPDASDAARVEPRFLPDNAPAANGQPFPLVLIQAMIAAAKADGHIDAAEQTRLFEQVEKLGLDAESKAFVFEALSQTPDLAQLAASANGIEQASEIYLVSRLAIDPDHPAERSYLDALAHRLELPNELVAHLEHQVEAGTEAT